jgi:hypothetical protein
MPPFDQKRKKRIHHGERRERRENKREKKKSHLFLCALCVLRGESSFLYSKS